MIQSLEFLTFVSTPDGSDMHKELVNALVNLQGEFEKVCAFKSPFHLLTPHLRDTWDLLPISSARLVLLGYLTLIN